MNLLDWFGGGASARSKTPPRARDNRVYLPDPMGRLGQGNWKPAGDRPDPFGRLSWLEPEPVSRFPITRDDDEISVIKPVGRRGANRPEDVGRIEKFLGATGHLDLDATDGPTGWYGQRLEGAVKDYQKDNGLKVDGVIKPGGETIQSLADLFEQSPGTAGGNRRNDWDRFWDSRTAPKVGVEPEDGAPKQQNMLLTPQDRAKDLRKSMMPMLDRPGYVWEDGDWRLETPEERARPKIVPLAVGEQAAGTQPESTDKPAAKPLSYKAVRELMGDLYQASKSGDEKRQEATRTALDFYPEADRKRNEEAAKGRGVVRDQEGDRAGTDDRRDELISHLPKSPTLDDRIRSEYGMDPNAERANILPNPNGSWNPGDWTAPQWLYEMARASLLPGHVAQGGAYTPEDVTNMALTIAGTGAGAATRSVPRNALGMPYSTTIPSGRWKARFADDFTDVYENPTKRELAEQVKTARESGTLRAMRLKDGRTFTWPAENVLHAEMADGLVAKGIVKEADLVGAERLMFRPDVGYYLGG